MLLSPEQQHSINDLVAQVNLDNVLQVAALLRKQADAMEDALYAADQLLRLEPCGQDPVSLDAVALFQPKIRSILDVHWAHHDELRGAVDALRASALGYGFNDLDLEAAFHTLKTI